MKNKIIILFSIMVMIFAFNASGLAQEKPVEVVNAEIKSIENIKKINGVIEPAKIIKLSSKSGGIVELIKKSEGDICNKGEELLFFEQDDIKIQLQQTEAALEIARTNHKKLLNGATKEDIKIAEASVKQAEAALEIAKSNYEKIKSGATAEDIERVEAAYEQALASNEGAKKSLELIKEIYNDRIVQKQQLIGAETQVEAAKKQMESARERQNQAENGLKQALNGLQQARTEFERIEYLYKEGAVTKKQYDLVESQLENARISVNNARSAIKSAQIGREQAIVNLDGAEKNYEIAKENYENPTQLKQQLDAANTQLRISEASKKMAKSNLDKTKKGAREEDIQVAYSNVKQAEAGLSVAREQLQKIKNGAKDEDISISEANIRQSEAALKQVKSRLEDTIMTCPAKGIISQINIEEGEMAGPGTPLFIIVNMEKVYIKIYVTADMLTYLQLGESVRANLLAIDDYQISGEIKMISPMADPQRQAYAVKILVNNEDNKLRGGMFTDVFLNLRSKDDALVIPVKAVLDLDGSPYVFINDEGVARRKNISTGIIDNNEVEVLEGLVLEDEIVVFGQSKLHDGDQLEVIN